MATVGTNPIVDGLSGMLGGLVFKNLRGKTFVSKSPQPPQRQSAQQKANRSKFHDASEWAKKILLDADKKAYYQKKAKKLKLPNAYTAAITDYMRRPKLTSSTNHDKSVTCYVEKKNFALQQVEVVLRNTTNDGEEVRLAAASAGEWMFRLTKEEMDRGVGVRVTDEAERYFEFRILRIGSF